MRYVGLLLNEVGNQTENPRSQVSDTAGVSDDTILEALSSAQSHLQSSILTAYPDIPLFDSKFTSSLLAGVSDYSVPSDALYGGSIRRVEYRTTSLERDYYDLDPENFRNLSGEQFNYPSDYALGAGVISISPIPSSAIGNLRVTYVRSLDRLDKRRGKVASVSSSSDDYLTITLEDDAYLDSDAIAANDFLCVNSSLGVVSYYNVNYTSYDSTTRVITLESGTALEDGVISVGDYITLNTYSTTHSKLPKDCERYLIAYAAWKLMRGDSSTDSTEQKEELNGIETEILSAMNNFSLQVNKLPVTDGSWLGD